MSAILETLDAIRRGGGRVWVESGDIRINAKAGVVTAERRAVLAEHKAVLVVLLGDAEADAARWLESLDANEGAGVVGAAIEEWRQIVGEPPPAPCSTCASALGWRSGKAVVCAGCCEPPADSYKVVLVDLPQPHWSDYAAERYAHDGRHDEAVVEPVVDPWDVAEPWSDATPNCQTCGSAAGWNDMTGDWHCWRCDPPHVTETLLAKREQILSRPIRRATPPPTRPAATPTSTPTTPKPKPRSTTTPQRTPTPSGKPRCSVHVDPSDWQDESPVDGRIRTVCKVCGAFIGFRSEKPDKKPRRKRPTGRPRRLDEYNPEIGF